MNSSLDFSKISWEEFQQLTLFLAEQKFDEPGFEEYLKKGHNQQGVDIIGLNRPIGKHFTVQCKHEKKISHAEFTDIIKLFENGDFGKTSSYFLLATTCDLQSPKIQAAFRQEQKRLKEERNIDFDLWDVNYFDTHLKAQYRIVHYFFSLEDADRHCFELPAEKKEFPPVIDYIDRSVTLLSPSDEDGTPIYEDSGRRQEKLSEVLMQAPFLTKQICVIADAYEGKSMLLRQTAFQLSTAKLPYEVIFLELKSVVIKRIADILKDRFRSWRESPGKNIMLIIDGLDEVPTDRFVDTVDHISEFMYAFGNVNLLFSCRRLFYNQYKLKKKLDGVEFYALNAMNYYQQQEFLSRNLDTDSIRHFQRTLYGLKIADLVDHPFYLINLVKWYRDSPESLPKNKIGVVKQFVEESLSRSAERKLGRGLLLQERRVRYRKALQRLALAFQIAGLNAADDDFVQTVVSEDESELILHSPIINRGAESWSFNNAIFQEQLAAMELENLKTAEILPLVTTGAVLRKVKNKWIQTIASAISLLDESSTLRSQLIEITRADNIELLTFSDGSKFSQSYRLSVLKEIMDQRIQRRNWLLIASETDVAAFIGNGTDSVAYLTSLLAEDLDPTVKVLALRILSHVQLDTRQMKDLTKAAAVQVSSVSDAGYGKHLIDCLRILNYQNVGIVDIAVKLPISSIHEFRNAVYKYLLKNRLVEQYYWFGLQGVKVLLTYNQHTSHHGSEHDLENFLLAVNTSSNLKALYLEMQKGDWQTFYGYQTDKLKSFLDRLVTLTIKQYQSDNTILLCVVLFVVKLQRLAVKDDYEALSKFFWQTRTNYQALLIFLALEKDYHWEFSDILDEKCMQYLLYACEEKEISKRTLKLFHSGLIHKKRIEEAGKFGKLIDDAFGKEASALEAADKAYAHHQKCKRANDQKDILSQEAFVTGVKRYFLAAGAKRLRYEHLYVEPTAKSARQEADGYFVREFISHMCTKKDEVTLISCLEFLSDPQKFENRRAYLLTHYSYQNVPHEAAYKTILQKYFNDNLTKANFENSYWTSPGRYHWKPMEVFLVEIWQKFGFLVADEVLINFIWLDTSGVRGMEHHQLNRTFSIAGRLLEHFSKQSQLLVNKVVENLSKGIKSSDVLGSHIAISKHLQIFEARPFILIGITSGHIRQGIEDAVDVFLTLGGKVTELSEFYEAIEDFDRYHFLHLSRLLINEKFDLVEECLNKAFWAVDVSQDQKNECASLLATKGNKTGFSYLISQLEQSAEKHTYIKFDPSIACNDTQWVIDQIEHLLPLAISRKGKNHPFNKDAGGFIVGLIQALAEKSEEDLLLISERLKKFVASNKASQPNVIFLLDYLDIAMENFRGKSQMETSAENIAKLWE